MRRIGCKLLSLVAATLGISAAYGQSKPQFKAVDRTRFDLSIGYNNIRANAPPGICQCFDLNGGFASGSMHITDWLRIAGEFTGGYSDHISHLGQGLTLTTFTAGPQVAHQFGRFTPYGEALVGGAHGSDSYFPSQTTSSSSASSFAFSTGGGVDFTLTPRYSIRAVDLQYLRTSFPNGTTNEQNHMTIGAGLVIKFHGGSAHPAPPPPPPVQAAQPPPPPPPLVIYTCGTNVANVPLGEMVVITGNARTEPAQLELHYAWSSSGGTIDGSGNVVSINTTGMQVGDYEVKGHAVLAANASIEADCVAVFRVVPVQVPAPSTTTIVNIEKDEKEFHENVKDAYFAVNSAKINPATLASIIHAAQYLVAHPKIQVIINGWTDSRGSVDFNLALGSKRADAIRNALIDAGVPPSQLEVLSNGKSSQVCTSKDAKCWQMNRRVSFSMKP